MKQFDGEDIYNEAEDDVLHIEVTDDEGRVGVLSADNVFSADWRDDDDRLESWAYACNRGTICEIHFGDDSCNYAAEEDIVWRS